MSTEASRGKYIVAFITCNVVSNIVGLAASWLATGLLLRSGSFVTVESYVAYSAAIFFPSLITWIVVFKRFRGVYFSKVVFWFVALAILSGLAFLGNQSETFRLLGVDYTPFQVWDIAFILAYIGSVFVYFSYIYPERFRPKNAVAQWASSELKSESTPDRENPKRTNDNTQNIQRRQDTTSSVDNSVKRTDRDQASPPRRGPTDVSLGDSINSNDAAATVNPNDRLSMILKYDTRARDSLSRLDGFPEQVKLRFTQALAETGNTPPTKILDRVVGGYLMFPSFEWDSRFDEAINTLRPFGESAVDFFLSAYRELHDRLDPEVLAGEVANELRERGYEIVFVHGADGKQREVRRSFDGVLRVTNASGKEVAFHSFDELYEYLGTPIKFRSRSKLN